MPTYVYTCTACGHTFEAVQSFSDDSLTVCPECDGALRKVYNAVGVVFKGGGFYRNDSRSANGGSSSGGSASGGSSNSSSSSTSSSASTSSSSTGSSSSTSSSTAAG